jgi:ATP-binding cassette subfamily C protein CydCD
VALTGANGSGKTTCLRLFLALAMPHSGTIRVGGIDLRNLNAAAWRKNIAFLPQRPYLPQRSDVRTAIRLLAPEASDESMLEALRRVGLLDALRRSSSEPLRVRTDTLSVGQRQRLALARFLCRDAPLLILDEPDANLDREGIALVESILRELSRDRAVLFVAHTPELVAIADRVITLDAARMAPADARPRAIALR